MNGCWKTRAVICAIALCGNSLRAQSGPSSGCADNKKRLAEVVAAAKTMPATEQLAAYLTFLTSVPDDPEDCVSSDVRAAISRVERNLISWKIGDRTYSPAKVLHCNEIDKPSQVCRGAELDDTPLSDETAPLSPVTTLPKLGMATLDVSKALGAKVVGVFAQDRSRLQDGKPPVRLVLRGGSLSLKDLQKWQHPVLILLLRSNDTLRFRKCVWLF
jgi:hypothetical protein